MNIRVQQILVVIGTVFAPMLAVAHSGHDHGFFGFTSGLLHPLTGFDHLVMLVASGVLIGCLGVPTSKKRVKLATLIGVGLLFTYGYMHGVGMGVHPQSALIAFSLGMVITATMLMLIGRKLGQHVTSRWVGIGVAALSSLWVIAF